MKRLYRIVLLCCLLCIALPLNALTDKSFPPEVLKYKVMYKWGLINKQAGTATISLKHKPDCYEATVTARSDSWADHFFKVRDTLIARMDYRGFQPLYYEKIAHEGHEDKHDVVHYDYTTPGLTIANTTRKVVKKGELRVDEERKLESENTALDILAAFYYMRTLPFETMKTGDVVTADIFSGKCKEILTIKYHGVVQADLDGKKRNTYYITFTFTSKQGKKTSDDMDAWLSYDSARIPLKLQGKLPVGKVHCIYTGPGK